MESKSSLDKPISTLQQILLGKYNDATLFQAFQLLGKILSNIVQNPNEQKFRKINKEANAIKTKLLAVKETEDLLKALGFIEQDGHLVYQSNDTDNLKKMQELVQTQETLIADRNITPEERAEKEKRKFLEERQRQIDEEFRKKNEEMKKLKELQGLDLKEQAQREKAKDSVCNNNRFGADVKGWKDIGVDLNAKRG